MFRHSYDDSATLSEFSSDFPAVGIGCFQGGNVANLNEGGEKVILSKPVFQNNFSVKNLKFFVATFTDHLKVFKNTQFETTS